MKKDIQFGAIPSDSNTQLIKIDTVNLEMSTVILDSFPTNGNNDFLLGRYKDPFLGTVTAKSFFQVAPPTDIDLPDQANYDSLELILTLTHYSYGDTTVPVTINVHELAEPIDYTFNNKLYNTSTISVKPQPLGSLPIRIRPVATDTISIRLDQNKGLDLFTLLKQRSDIIKNEDQFINYFKGLSLSIEDTAAVYGLSATSANIKLRLHYHEQTPIYKPAYKEFSLKENDLRFTQILSDRKNTSFPLTGNRVQEIAAHKLGQMAVTQSTAGVLTKITVPSLRDVLFINPTVQLLKAEIYLTTTSVTPDQALPSKLYLAQTNATNTIGPFLSDSSGKNDSYSSPYFSFDNRSPAFYRYNITSYIQELLTTQGRKEYGFYVLEELPGQTKQLNRAIFGNRFHSSYKSQLVLTLLTIKQ